MLSHYDLGVIKRIREHRRGSRRAPKLRITAKRGEFLLKRRAPGRDDPYRVAFAHDLQLYLADRGYPVPGLIGTQADNNSMLQLHGRIYEMFRFVEGTHENKSLAAAKQSGVALGRLHGFLANYRPTYTSPSASYHAAAGIDGALLQIPVMVAAADPGAPARDLEKRCSLLGKIYHDAAGRAESAGFAAWPRRVLHGDWHPGNLLFKDDKLAAVLDFDSARVEPRMIDIANAALQFSMKMADPEDPDAWPDQLDVKRIGAIVAGYNKAASDPISPGEKQALPWLIIEALILESVLPIAATGRFARLNGSTFLRMVDRKVRWLGPRAKKLLEYLETEN